MASRHSSAGGRAQPCPVGPWNVAAGRTKTVPPSRWSLTSTSLTPLAGTPPSRSSCSAAGSCSALPGQSSASSTAPSLRMPVASAEPGECHAARAALVLLQTGLTPQRSHNHELVADGRTHGQGPVRETPRHTRLATLPGFASPAGPLMRVAGRALIALKPMWLCGVIAEVLAGDGANTSASASRAAPGRTPSVTRGRPSRAPPGLGSVARWLPLLATLAAFVPLLLAHEAAAQTTLGAPTIASHTAGNSTLTISWSAPGDDGGSVISAYDVLYILSDASDKARPTGPSTRTSGVPRASNTRSPDCWTVLSTTYSFAPKTPMATARGRRPTRGLPATTERQRRRQRRSRLGPRCGEE